jgi:Tfp pilus assembly protein PilX
MKLRYKNSQGQALVLVLLALAVVLTIVLFVLSRSITDIAVSSSESSAVSAFSAAEAGVEQALVIGSGGSATVGSGSYTSQVSSVGLGSSSFVYPIDINSGDSMTLWLNAQDANSSDFDGSTLKICWGKSGEYANSALVPAIEAVVFYETVADVPASAKIARAAFDPNESRRVSNSFSAAGGSCGVGGQSFGFQATLDLSEIPNPQFVLVRMFYNTDSGQPLAFDSTDGALFPSQGILVDSSGVSGQSSRKVQVFQGWPEIPAPFQFAIYSSTGLTK